MKTFLLLATLVLADSMGVVLAAKGMKKVGDLSLRPRELLGGLARTFSSPWLMGGVFFMAISFFSFLGLLNYEDLSYVVPMTAVSYIVKTLGARLFLKEQITGARWIGTLLVATGVALVSLPQSAEEIITAQISRGLRGLVALLNQTDAPLPTDISEVFWSLFALRLALLICVMASIVYYCGALWAGWLWFRDRRRQRALGLNYTPPITILIPVRGADSNADEVFAGFCRQDYPDYQIIFGARDEADPAVAVIQRVMADFPTRRIELVISPAEIGYNAKVSNLQNMSARAAHDLLLIVDSDIRVGADYLRRIVAPMQDKRVGMVTCLYRGAGARTFGALLEHLGISSTFAPEVITARALEGIKFALGSTILMRRELLEGMGGFRAVADYLADDYLLGNYTALAGYEVVLSDYVVEHASGPETLSGMLRHQLRWGRTVRLSRPKGYAGLILTYGTSTSLLLLLMLNFSSFGWTVFGVTLVMRLLSAWMIGVVGLGDRTLAKYFWLVPLRDLIGFGVWIASFAGNEIYWRGTIFQVLPGGKIKPIGEP
jgi:ceramide glucosyltransferase